MALDLKKIFSDGAEILFNILKKTTVETAAKIPEVQQAVKTEAVEKGKDVLWAIAPLAACGVMIAFLAITYKK